MRLKYAITATCLLATSAGAVAASPAAFRGLDGGSRRPDVMKVFPAAKPKNDCAAGETERKSSEGSTSCNMLVFDGYELNDTTFDLTFQFNLDGTLRYVSVIKIMGTPGGADRGVDKLAIERLFSTMIEPLSARYGQSVTDAPGAYFKSKYKVGEIEWQPGNGREWRSGVDRVKLSADAIERIKWPATYFGSVHIWYSFVRRADVSKL